jgi:hypothetical protein
LTSALDGDEWPVSRPGRFTPMESAPGTNWMGGWVGPRAVLGAIVKRKIPSPRWESNPRIPIVPHEYYTTGDHYLRLMHEHNKTNTVSMRSYIGSDYFYIENKTTK